MPFTPYHLGPPLLLIGILNLIYKDEEKQNKYLLFLIFLFGAVIPDLQGIYSLFFDTNVPLHGFSHTIFGAMLYSLISVIILEVFNNLTNEYFGKYNRLNIFALLFCSILVFHFVPDMFIWSDMHMFAPFSSKTFGIETNYRPIANILGACFLIGLIMNIVIAMKGSLE